MEIRKRFLSPPHDSFFLFGPRGTGKSTWLSQVVPEALYIDLLSQEAYSHYLSSPDRLHQIIAGNPAKTTIVIDEIQRVPSLLPVVHQLLEKRKDLRFILTGSSSRKLKREGIDLLGGRALLRTCHPFMASELGDLFSIDEALKTGMVPLVRASAHSDDTLRAYLSLYLREEVQAEGLVRNMGHFSRFLEAISFSHGSQLSVSDISRECEVNRKTVEGFISILEDLLLAYKLPVFSKRAKRHLVKQRKFYFFDTGVFRGFRPKGPLDRREEIDGAALEGLIFQHLMALIEYQSDDCALYYWRTKSGVEIDFIIYGESQFLAIEVKNSTRITSKDLRALRTFKMDYPEALPYVVYRGEEQLMIDGIFCVPCEIFLEKLIPGHPVDHPLQTHL